MIDRFVVFDVETPNHENNRMSSIGVSVVDDLEIVYEKYFLINPLTYFDIFNMELTGITPEMVCDKPAIYEIWDELSELFSGRTLVAHNAPFDMSVLAKCINDYKLPFPRYADYICTCRMGRKCYPQFPNHKLDTLCRYLDIHLSHHNALSDSHACAELLIDYIGCGMDTEAFVKSYDILGCCTLKKR